MYSLFFQCTDDSRVIKERRLIKSMKRLKWKQSSYKHTWSNEANPEVYALTQMKKSNHEEISNNWLETYKLVPDDYFEG